MNNSHFNQSEQKMLPIIITCSFRKLDGESEVLTQNSSRQLAKSPISLTCSNPTAANFYFFTSYIFVKIISPMIKGHASAKKIWKFVLKITVKYKFIRAFLSYLE